MSLRITSYGAHHGRQRVTTQPTPATRQGQVAPPEARIEKNGAQVTVQVLRNKEAEARRQDETTTAVSKDRYKDQARYQNEIYIDERGKNVLVFVNGEAHKFSKHDARNLVIRGSSGRDVILVGGEPDPFGKPLVGAGKSAVKLNLRVEAGDGKDLVMVNNSGRTVINGGKDNDSLVSLGRGGARINGSEGSDYLDGLHGTNVLSGGKGDDNLRAGDGKNVLVDHRGTNFLASGTGTTRIETGGDHSIVSAVGGRTEVTTRGGSTTVYAGANLPQIHNLLGGRSTVYADKRVAALFPFQVQSDLVGNGGPVAGGTEVRPVDMSTRPGGSLRIEGTPEFKQRVEQDLDLLRSSPVGRSILSALDRASAQSGHKTITIRYESQFFNQSSNGPFEKHPGSSSLSSTGEPGAPIGGSIGYNLGTLTKNGRAKRLPPQQLEQHFHQTPLPFPSVVQLAHELIHAYNALSGTYQPGKYKGPGLDKGIDNRERQAVGLPNDGVPYDFDHNPATPKTTANPTDLTENGLRAELEIARRTSYRR